MTDTLRTGPKFADEGRGDPIVFLHAFPLDATMWDAERAELSRDRRVIVPDLRGFGASATLSAPSVLDEHADDIARLLTGLGIERATVAGLSMGGYIALALARRHPQRLARLILADTKSAPDSPDGRRARDENIELVRSQGVPPLVERLLPKLLSAGASPEVVARVRALGGRQTREAIASALAAMRDRADSTPMLAAIDVPTLVIVGEADSISPPAEARAMASALPRGELTIIAGAGHLTNLESPSAFMTAIRKFLDG
ncbi:MAG TPA: alpha/beta fold hydrolase [Polyangiaceae bacterium]|nr:alpha/beta fold hydrolase [Polyangiaceae bacterium]